MAGKDSNIGAKRAREARDELGVGVGEPVGCILSVVEARAGVPVVIATLPEGIAGCCWRDGGRIVLWVNASESVVRQRFTLAHEFGHVRCNHDGAVPVETFETLGGKATDSREVQANAFAAEFLAPAVGLQRMLSADPLLEDVVRIAARFGISAIAALYRLNSLGLTAHYEVLHAQIDDGEHEALRDGMTLDPVEDLIGAIDAEALPRLSPALEGSALAAVAEGMASVVDAAAVTGCDEAALASGASVIGV